jgi:hypothetical protein
MWATRDEDDARHTALRDVPAWGVPGKRMRTREEEVPDADKGGDPVPLSSCRSPPLSSYRRKPQTWSPLVPSRHWIEEGAVAGVGGGDATARSIWGGERDLRHQVRPAGGARLWCGRALTSRRHATSPSTRRRWMGTCGGADGVSRAVEAKGGCRRGVTSMNLCAPKI